MPYIFLTLIFIAPAWPLVMFVWQILHDLQLLLDLQSHLTSPLENVNFEYGFNTNYLKKVVEFWKKTKYSGPLTYELNSFPRAGRKSRLFFP